MDQSVEPTSNAPSPALGAGEVPTDIGDARTAHLGPVDACPECGGHDFATQNRDDTVVFVCVGCNIAWRYELSYVWPASIE